MFQDENFASMWQAQDLEARQAHEALQARVYEEMIKSEIFHAIWVARLQSYPDEMPARLYPTSQLTAEQS